MSWQSRLPFILVSLLSACSTGSSASVPPPEFLFGINDSISCQAGEELWHIALDGDYNRLRWMKNGVTNTVSAVYSGNQISWGDVHAPYMITRNDGGFWLNHGRIGSCVLVARDY